LLFAIVLVRRQSAGNVRASLGLKLAVGDRTELVAMKRLAVIVVCLAVLATLSACAGDYYYWWSFPGSQFDPGSQ
jgi:hypothetical protein